MPARSKAAAKAVETAEAQVQVIEEADKALTPYLDGKVYDQERLVSEVEFLYQQHTTSAFELGKRLIVLKANCQHGQFSSAILNRVGLTASYASNLMAFARTVVESAALTNGKLDVKRLAAMDYRKVLLLGEVIAEDAEEIAETGRINGRTIDEWDAMTRAELKATIRKQQDQIATGIEQNQRMRDKVLKEQDRIKELLSATPDAVCASVTRMGQHLRDALASFEATCLCDDELEPDSPAMLDLVALRAQLRTFYDRTMTLIETRFPTVVEAEVPTDVNLTHPGTTGNVVKLID